VVYKLNLGYTCTHIHIYLLVLFVHVVHGRPAVGRLMKRGGPSDEASKRRREHTAGAKGRGRTGGKWETGAGEDQRSLPATFIGEAIAHGAHMVANRGPFAAADDANVLDGQDGEKQVFVGAVIPILVHLGRVGWRGVVDGSKAVWRGLWPT